MFKTEVIKERAQWRPLATDDVAIFVLDGNATVNLITLPCELSSCSYIIAPAGQCLDISLNDGSVIIASGDLSRFELEQGSVGLIDEVSATVLYDTFTANSRRASHCDSAVSFVLNQLSAEKAVLEEFSVELDFVDSVVDYMTKHMDEPLTLAVICDEFDCSKLQLNNRFKEKGHKPPMKVLADIRIERSVELLEKSDLTISQIANATGYANLSAFSHFFKKMTGQSPNQIRSNVNWLM